MTLVDTPPLSRSVEAYYEDLFRLIYRKTGDVSLTEDVIQDAWLRAKRSEAVTPANPKAYIRRMAINIAIDHLRKNRIRGIETPPANENDAPMEIAAPIADIEDAVAARQEMTVLYHAIRQMPQTRRTAFLFCRVAGLTMREAARKMGLSERTVEKHVARALIECRRALIEAGRAL